MHRAVARNLVYVPVQYLRGVLLRAALQELEATETYEPARLRAYQWRKAQALLSAAYRTVPLYRRRLQERGLTPGDITDLDAWKRLPMLSKDDIVARREELRSEERRWRVTTKTTGGSTGRAVTIEKDPAALSYEDAAMWRGLAWNGIRIGDKQARFWGVPIRLVDRAKYVLIDRVMNRIRLSAFELSDASMRAFFNAIERVGTDYFYGYTSVIVAFAEFVRKSGLRLRRAKIKLIVTTSEPLYDSQKALLQEVFGCRVIRDYGCGELGPIAYECEEDGFHLFANTLLVEVLDGDWPAKSGQVGELVITDLHNFRMPLIRYRIKDYGALSDGSCPCGRTLPLLERVVGRVLDTVVLPSRTRIHGEYFNYISEEMRKRSLGLRQLQVLQTELDRLVVRIVREARFDERSLDVLRTLIRRRVTEDVAIDYEFVDEIRREASGKMRLVVSRCADVAG